jgi:hypothetical protein
MGEQKSAEAVVAAAQSGEGPNVRSRTGAMRSRREGDADTRAERPERPRRAGGGTAEGTGAERQARPARGEQAGEKASMLMEKVLRREKVYPSREPHQGAPKISVHLMNRRMPNGTSGGVGAGA